MKIVVTTPTGNVGSEVARLLVRAGKRPTLLLRHPDKLDAELLEHVDVVQGDQLALDDVLSATEGADALFWVDPPGGEEPLAQYRLAGENAAAAVERHAIDRTVFQSSIGAELRSGAGEIDGLGITEQLLDATGRSVVHLRCGFFFSNLLLDPTALEKGVTQVVLPVDQPIAWVAPQDIAEVATTWLLSTAWSGRHVQAVHGPADLSWTEAAAIVSDATGRPFRAERVGDDAMRDALAGAGMNDAQVDGILGMSTGLRDGFTPEQPRTLQSTTPTTLASWAREHLAAA